MLKIRNLSKTFNIGTENEINIFDKLNLEIESKECVSIIGSNGCGKSTLLNMIGGSVLSDNGEIMLDDINLSSLKEEDRSVYIGRVYQDPSMGVASSLTILENMSLADKKGEKFTLKKLIKKDKINSYKKLLKDLDLGLENKLNTKVKFLSGGQRQALSLIMATMKYPKLLLLDEHTAALDPKTSKVIMKKTKELIKKCSITTVMISHNMKDAINYSNRIIMLDRGKIILDKPSTDVTEDELVGIYKSKLNEQGIY
ncbi:MULTISPECIES: ABC transporter ATP-binding protein [Tissierellales]|uniref:ATP-binding cassette domain-containing protein n=1 Tax=Acidilutibacter cellobiosedens TaxID=2507161 RepID=A0A410QCR6_9FIRM|nr:MULTISPECIES: ATP-binding cassette domain-containing protein [Tissierellales]QAT61852.1 ATP-binding cassette domain-containing protein [Acidilutibacter cellobiosedens]SCL81895.1 Spermidine/putrescine import ATP-binding protein PotA [Sporanaerobacter sp. PP17-6a]